MAAFLSLLVIVATVIFLVIALKRQGTFDSKEVRSWKYFLARAGEFKPRYDNGRTKTYSWTGPDGRQVDAVVWKGNSNCSIFIGNDCILNSYFKDFSHEMAKRLLAIPEEEIDITKPRDNNGRYRKRSSSES